MGNMGTMRTMGIMGTVYFIIYTSKFIVNFSLNSPTV